MHKISDENHIAKIAIVEPVLHFCETVKFILHLSFLFSALGDDEGKPIKRVCNDAPVKALCAEQSITARWYRSDVVGRNKYSTYIIYWQDSVDPNRVSQFLGHWTFACEQMHLLNLSF